MRNRMVLAEALVKYADSRQNSAGLQLRRAEVISVNTAATPDTAVLDTLPGITDEEGNDVGHIDATVIAGLTISVSNMVYFLQQGSFALVIGKV